MTTAGRRAVTIASAVLLLSGCSSASSGGQASSAGGHEETRPAAQIYADALEATGKQPAIHLSITGNNSTGVVTKIEADITAEAGRLVTTESSSVTTIVVVGGRSYAQQGGAFVELPSEVNSNLQSLTLNKSLSCARVEHGTLSKGAVTAVNGRRVITVLDDGKYPGDAPGTTYVALDGPPLLIRTTTSGPETPGGSAECGHSSKSTTVKQQDDFDYSRGPVTITPPPVSSGAGPGPLV